MKSVKPIHQALPCALLLLTFCTTKNAHAAWGLIDDSEKGFWDKYALILAKPTGPIADGQLDIAVLRTLSTSFPVPGQLTVSYPGGGDNSLPVPPPLFLLLVYKDPATGNFAAPTYGFKFLPTDSSVTPVKDESDPQIAAIAKKVADLRLLRQQEEIAQAKQKADQKQKQKIDEYNDFWKTHALILAKTSENQGGPFRSLHVEASDVLFTRSEVPLAFTGRTVITDAVVARLAKGETAVILLSKDKDGTWAIGGRIPAIPTLDELGVVEVKSNQDPQITQILKSVQAWQQQILNPTPTTQPPSPALSPATPR